MDIATLANLINAIAVIGSRIPTVKIVPLYLVYATGLSVTLAHRGFHVGSYLAMPKISRADAADFMLNQLTSDAYLGAAPSIAW